MDKQYILNKDITDTGFTPKPVDDGRPKKCMSDKCLLFKGAKTPCMTSQGSRKPEFLFIVDLSEDDDLSGQICMSKAGQLLKDVIIDCGIDIEKCAFTPAVKCCAYDHKGRDRSPMVTEVNRCKPLLMAEIRVLQPDVIVMCGASALKALTGESGISSKRGRLFQNDDIDGCDVLMATLNPGQCLYDPSLIPKLVEDISSLVHKKAKPKKAIKCVYELVDTMGKVKEMFRTLMSAEEIAFDVETSGLNPFIKGSYIVCINLSYKEGHAYVVPITHFIEPVFTGKALEKVVTICKLILENDVTKIGQNAKFDKKWLKVVLDIEVNNFTFDTMLAQYLISEDKGSHGLDTLAWLYTSMGGYDKPLVEYVATHKEANPKKGGSYASIPWDVLVPYAGGDTDATLRVKHVLEEKLKEEIKVF